MLKMTKVAIFIVYVNNPLQSGLQLSTTLPSEIFYFLATHSGKSHLAYNARPYSQVYQCNKTRKDFRLLKVNVSIPYSQVYQCNKANSGSFTQNVKFQSLIVRSINATLRQLNFKKKFFEGFNPLQSGLSMQRQV